MNNKTMMDLVNWTDGLVKHARYFHGYFSGGKYTFISTTSGIWSIGGWELICTIEEYKAFEADLMELAGADKYIKYVTQVKNGIEKLEPEVKRTIRLDEFLNLGYELSIGDIVTKLKGGETKITNNNRIIYNSATHYGVDRRYVVKLTNLDIEEIFELCNNRVAYETAVKKQEKPVFTQAMKDAGELPKRGMLVTDNTGDECVFIAEFEGEAWLNSVTNTEGAWCTHCDSIEHLKPIDQRTQQQKQVESAVQDIHSAMFDIEEKEARQLIEILQERGHLRELEE